MIYLTELASINIRQRLKRRNHGLGIKVGVKNSGCSGFSYVLEYVDSIEGWNPVVFEQLDVSIYIDPKDLIYIDGMTIDWKQEGLNEGFDFINPQEESRCGCGESFKI